MRKRSPRLTEYPSYDSFLDFMTNVAGFLILLVVITPLGVSSAVQDIQSSSKAKTPEEMQAAREEAARLMLRLQELREERDALQASTAEGAPDLARLQDVLQSLESEARRRQAAPAVGDLNEESSALEAEAEESRRLLEAKRNEFDAVAREDGMFQGWSGERRSLRVPDPRKVPEGMKRFEILCIGNKVCPFDVDGLNEVFNREGLDVGALTKNARGMSYHHEKGSDLSRRLATKDIGNEFFRLSFSDNMVSTTIGNLGNIYLEYALRPGAVLENGTTLQAEESKYRKVLKGLAPKECWIYYFVYDDSFAAYHLARKIAEEMGFQAGWVAFSAGTQEEPNVEKLRFPLIGSSGTALGPD